MRIDHALELSHAYRGTALLLGDVVEADDELHRRAQPRRRRPRRSRVADELGLDARDERRDAEFAALLHDVGKVRIPSEIINKPGPLDDAEWAIMKTHTIEGEGMLERVGGLLGDVGRIVRSCHERWDGGGYPDGLAGEEIPLVARIVVLLRRLQRDDDRPPVPAGDGRGGGVAGAAPLHAGRSSTREVVDALIRALDEAALVTEPERLPQRRPVGQPRP